MYHRLTKEAYFNRIIDSNDFSIPAKKFFFLPYLVNGEDKLGIHDTSLEFDTHLKQYLTENVDKLGIKAQGVKDKQWIAILWRRSAVGEFTQSIQYKKVQFYLPPTEEDSNEYALCEFRMGSVKMEMAFYSNDPDYLEDFEEAVFLDFPIAGPISVFYPNLSTTQSFKNLITEHTHNTVIKEPRETYGTLGKLQTSCIFNFAIPRYIRIIKKVKHIALEIATKSIDQAIADFEITVDR